jgi:hypothetical protein
LQLHCLETGEKHAGKSNASPRPTIAMDRKFSPEFSAIGRTDDGGCTILPSALEHFRAKWMPVRVKKMRQNKKPEYFRAKWTPVRVRACPGKVGAFSDI